MSVVDKQPVFFVFAIVVLVVEAKVLPLASLCAPGFN